MADGPTGGSYSLSDVAGGGRAPQAAPSPGGSSGGYSLSDVAGGGGGAAAPAVARAASPAVSPAPAASTAKKGGGGFFSKLGKGLANFINPLNTPKLVGKVAGAALTDVHNVGDIIGGHVSPLFQGDVAGAAQGAGTPEHLRAAPGEDFLHYLGRVSPVMGGVVTGAQRTGADIAGGVQAITPGHALGQGFQHAAAQRFDQNPFGEVLNDVGTAALMGGPLSRALEVANVPGAAAVGRVGDVAGKAMAAPFAPYKAVAGAAGEGLARVTGKSEAGPITSRIAESKVGQGIQRIEQGKAVRSFLTKNVEVPTRIEQAREAASLSAMHKAVGGDQEMIAAVNLRQIGATPALKAVLATGEDHAEPILAAQGISVRTARLAAGEGTTAEEQALTKAAALRTEPNATRTAEELAGRGRVNGPMNPEQAGATPMESRVGALTADTEVAAHDAEAALRTAKAEAGIRTDSADLLNGRTPRPADVPELVRASRMLSRAGSVGPAAFEQLRDLATAHGLSSPEQIPEYLAQVKEALGQSNPRDPAVLAADRAAQRARAAADEAHAQAMADPANAPARYRPALLLGQRLVSDLHDAARRADAVAPGGGDLLREGAAQIPTVMQKLVDEGIDPQHLIGPGRQEATAEGQAATQTAKRSALPQVKKLTSENQKTAGTIPADVSELAKPNLARIARVIANEAAPKFQEQFGKTAADLGIEAEPGWATDQAVRHAGYVPWNPRAWTETVAPAAVTADTPLLPKTMYQEFGNHFRLTPSHPAAQAWDALIHGGKNLTVALNPGYHAAVIVGDTIKASALGGVDPVSLGARMVEAIKLMKNEPENPMVAELRGSGLSAEQADELGMTKYRGQGKGVTSRLAAPAWTFSRYVQDVQRIGLALAKQGQGMAAEDAVAEATKVMGDFRHLSPFEQNVVRRIIPGYAFVKAITKLAIDLPINSPERLAWLNYLSQASGNAGKNEPSFVNPFDMIGTVPSLAPPIRLASESIFGFKPSTSITKARMVSSPEANLGGMPASPLTHGNAALSQIGNLAANLVPAARIGLAALRPNEKRYDTGEPIESKKGPEPYPGGRLAGVLYAAGLQSPTPKSATPTKAQKAAQKRNAKSLATYERRRARLGG